MLVKAGSCSLHPYYLMHQHKERKSVDYLLVVSYLMYLTLSMALSVILLNYDGFPSRVVGWVVIGAIYVLLVTWLLRLYLS
jgi:hypothetical protein